MENTSSIPLLIESSALNVFSMYCSCYDVPVSCFAKGNETRLRSRLNAHAAPFSRHS